MFTPAGDRLDAEADGFVPARRGALGAGYTPPMHTSVQRVLAVCFVVALTLSIGTTTSAQGQDFSMRGQYTMVKGWITKAAAMIPETDYGFKPTPDVRSIGQLLGHIANSTGMICLAANGSKTPIVGNAEQFKTKAELQKALADSFAACDAVWNASTPAWATETTNLFGAQQSRLTALTFNTAHTYEHYGNLVTYMRLKGLVPPSSGGN